MMSLNVEPQGSLVPPFLHYIEIGPSVVSFMLWVTKLADTSIKGSAEINRGKDDHSRRYQPPAP